MEEETSKEALERALKIQRELFPFSSGSLQANRVTAEIVLKQDLGRFADRYTPYHLDQETRDLLLAHARQDAAHALLNTISIIREIDKLKKELNTIGLSLLFLFVGSAVWKYWPFIKEWLESASSK